MEGLHGYGCLLRSCEFVVKLCSLNVLGKLLHVKVRMLTLKFTVVGFSVFVLLILQAGGSLSGCLKGAVEIV